MAAKATLFELTERRALLLELVEQAEGGENGELSEEEMAEANASLREFLADTVQDWQEKVDSYVVVARALQARAKALRAEARHLTEMARATESQLERLKDTLRWVAQENDWNKLRGHSRSISIYESGVSVQVEDIDALPLMFKEPVPATYRPIKKLIAKYIKATGEAPAGASYELTVVVRFR